MIIFQASMSFKVIKKYNSLFPDKKINVLRSFGNLDKDMYEIAVRNRDMIGSLILDSGAWTYNNASAMTAAKITRNKYKNYARRFGYLFNFYFNFDSDFHEDGFGANLANQRILEEAELHPVPVIHNILSDEIQFYIDQKRYPIIALGSKQITNMDTLAIAMDKFHGSDVRVHLFGNSKFEFITQFPLFSCDITTWAKTGAYGEINYWNKNRNGINKTDNIYTEERISVKDKHRHMFSTYPFRQELEQFLWDTLNVTYDDILGPDGAFYKQLVNTHYYVQLEEIVNNIHRQKGFIK